MSQEQPRRPQAEPVRYGDLFDVSDELACKPVAPRDAAVMQAAETVVLGQTQKAGPAAVMQSAADVNENRGVVGHDDITDVARDSGVTVSEAVIAGRRVIAEAVGGEVVGGYAAVTRPGAGQSRRANRASGTGGRDEITIGEALEATALSAGDKPVDESDAAAIQAAEVRATGRGQVMPGGIGAEAQSAANTNPRLREEAKTKLGDVLGDATDRLPRDKPASREDAERVVAAEVRNDPDACPHPGGVAVSIATAARLNQGPCP